MSNSHDSEPQQPYYTHGYPPQYDRVAVGNTRLAGPLSLVSGIVGLVLVTLTGMEWLAWLLALAAIFSGLVGCLRPAARDKYVSMAGIALGIVALTIGLAT